VKGTILVIEDDKATAGMIQEFLEAEDYRTLYAVDGDSIPVALAERPDVILLDVNMPGMDGPEVSRRLRADPATARIPIIGMSAGGHRGGTPSAMAANDWLSKPFPLDDLLAKVDHWGTAR